MQPVYRFCPLCAHSLESKFVFGRERRVCPGCGWVYFQDPKLAVGGLVVQEGRVLLIRRAVLPRIGYWAVPSGFVEYDEQPRAALAREIAEETGLQVEVGRVLDVYANADERKPGVFLLFQAQPLGGYLRPGDDVSEVRWFARDEVPRDKLAFAHMDAILERLWEAF